MVFGKKYPYSPPKILCLSEDLYHPNICFLTKEMKFEIIDSEIWKPNFQINEVFNNLENLIIDEDKRYFTLENLDLCERFKNMNINHENKSDMDMERIKFPGRFGVEKRKMDDILKYYEKCEDLGNDSNSEIDVFEHNFCRTFKKFKPNIKKNQFEKKNND